MKIEANPTPEQLKWLLLVVLVACGYHADTLMGLVV